MVTNLDSIITRTSSTRLGRLCLCWRCTRMVGTLYPSLPFPSLPPHTSTSSAPKNTPLCVAAFCPRSKSQGSGTVPSLNRIPLRREAARPIGQFAVFLTSRCLQERVSAPISRPDPWPAVAVAVGGAEKRKIQNLTERFLYAKCHSIYEGSYRLFQNSEAHAKMVVSPNQLSPSPCIAVDWSPIL